MTADFTDALRQQIRAAACHLLNKPLRHGKLRSLMGHLLSEKKARS